MESLFSRLDSDVYLLTDNANQAQFLLKTYADYQKKQNKKAWVDPNIMPLSSWLQKQWHHLLDSAVSLPLLLSEHQQYQLWQQAISSEETQLDITMLISLSKNTHRLIQDWKINQSEIHLSDANQLWLTWYENYLKQCEKLKGVDAHRWLNELTSWMNHTLNEQFNLFLFPKTILLFGFYEFSSAEKLFFEAFKNKNRDVIEVDIKTKKNNVFQLPCKDSRDEIHSMAAWAKQKVKEGRKVTCLVPFIKEIKPSLLRAFENEQIYIHDQDYFANIPLIYAALLFLEMLKNKLSIEKWSAILRSPFFGGYSKEKSARAIAVEALYKKNEFEFSLNHVVLTCEQCPDFISRIRTIAQSKLYLSPSEWTTIFLEILNQLGWPGENSLTAYEQEVFQSWQDLLMEFSQLETLKETLSLYQALSHLQQLASAWHFQPSHNKEASIRIFPYKNVYGLQFDALWVLGLQDSVLPAMAKPNPILPLALQRALKIPHASHEWELTYSKAWMQKIKNAASTTIFSYSQQDEQGELSESYFLNEIEKISKENVFSFPVENKEEKMTREYYDDDQGVCVENETLKGGSAIFRDHALCAFRGYAKHRLNATETPVIRYGFTPIEKGKIIHRVLELVWSELKTQQRLLTTPHEKLILLIQEKIELAALSLLKHRPHLNASTLLKLEKQRLEKILLRWLDYEKSRDDFDVVALEKAYEVHFQNLNFNLRIDRIDHVGSQTYYLIDYKTGQASIQDWLDDRMNEPQLPLYSLVSDIAIHGLVFAQLRADKLGFRGLAIESSAAGILPIQKIKKDIESASLAWSAQMESWQTALMNLAHQIKKGVATLNPKEGLKTCDRCDLHPVCRVHSIA